MSLHPLLQGVSTTEQGFYKCVSKPIASGATGLKIENVELLVKKDWEEVYEDDTEVRTQQPS